MGEMPKSATLFFMGATFILGCIVGKSEMSHGITSNQKEIIELSIELTKL